MRNSAHNNPSFSVKSAYKSGSNNKDWNSNDFNNYNSNSRWNNFSSSSIWHINNSFSSSNCSSRSTKATSCNNSNNKTVSITDLTPLSYQVNSNLANQITILQFSSHYRLSRTNRTSNLLSSLPYHTRLHKLLHRQAIPVKDRTGLNPTNREGHYRPTNRLA